MALCFDVDPGDADVRCPHPRQMIDDDTHVVNSQVNDVNISPAVSQVLRDEPPVAAIRRWLAAQKNRCHVESTSRDSVLNLPVGH